MRICFIVEEERGEGFGFWSLVLKLTGASDKIGGSVVVL